MIFHLLPAVKTPLEKPLLCLPPLQFAYMSGYSAVYSQPVIFMQCAKPWLDTKMSHADSPANTPFQSFLYKDKELTKNHY